MTARRILLATSFSILACSAHAQNHEVALFFWAAFGGAALLLLVLIGWFLRVVLRGSHPDGGGNPGQVEDHSKGKRLGE